MTLAHTVRVTGYRKIKPQSNYDSHMDAQRLDLKNLIARWSLVQIRPFVELMEKKLSKPIPSPLETGNLIIHDIFDRKKNP